MYLNLSAITEITIAQRKIEKNLSFPGFFFITILGDILVTRTCPCPCPSPCTFLLITPLFNVIRHLEIFKIIVWRLKNHVLWFFCVTFLIHKYKDKDKDKYKWPEYRPLWSILNYLIHNL